MLKRLSVYTVLFLGLVSSFLAGPAAAQTGNAGSIDGVVNDPSGGVIAGATVEISNPVSRFNRQGTTGSDGSFHFSNVPFNPYHMVVTAPGFNSFTQDVEVRSTVPTSLQISLKVGTEVVSVTVEANGGDLVENESTFHTDVDQAITDRLPLQSTTSGVSSLVTLVTPGIAADSNGLFHGLGDHAQNSFSVDNQPISDQQSKVFSNQLPTDSIQSLEVITGAPPAEFGDKTSIVIKVTTRSGLGVTKPTGRVYGTYGSFGTGNLGVNLAFGGQKWGNFIAANGLNTGRFLDGPEIAVLHDKGNQENVFDRVDYQIAAPDTIHVNFNFTRSWFQNPNTWDQQLHTCGTNLFACNSAGVAVNPLNGAPLGKTDQRSQIKTYNIAPTWTHLIGTKAVFTFGGFVRHDQFNFYPSADPYADFSPALQAQTIGQDRKLTNAGLRADISYVKGMHNIKAGITSQHWFLTESDILATVDPAFLGLFFDSSGTGATCTPTDMLAPCPTLRSVDLTIANASGTGPVGQPFLFHGHTDVKETSLYLQDTITKGNWSFNLGIRGDIYNGYVSDRQPEPRVGVSYNIKPSSTVLRLSYARTMETPFNENLIIANTGCNIAVIAVLVPPPNTPSSLCNSSTQPIRLGQRNEFHAGLEQAFGKYLVVDAEYLWKYTHNGYDFGVVAASPLAFPLAWHNSKIPGYAVRVSVPNFHGFTGLVVMSGVAARYFPPQVAGIPFLPAPGVFRIDHDEKFNQTTHLQYQPWKRGPWVAFNWRYDNGLVAGAVPCLAATATCSLSTSTADGGLNTMIGKGEIGFVNNLTGLPLTPDQEFQAGFTCQGVGATPTTPIPASVLQRDGGCLATQFGSKYIRVPGPGQENDDHHPQRIAPRNLFDASVGADDLFHGDRYKWSLRFTVINLTNKTALYNFFSTFSGTHYVTPRTETVELGFHF